MAQTVLELLREAESRLCQVDSPRLSAEVLLAAVVGCSRLGLVLDRERVLNPELVSRYQAMVERRASGEPLAYILGVKEFYGLDFEVSPSVLIPRPETEHIVEEVESWFARNDSFHFSDWGTGSGILAVCVAHLFPRATGVAVDISRDALDLAQRNGTRHGVTDRLDFLLGDFTKPLFGPASFDLIVSNPPYVTEAEYDQASHEVTAFEPMTALTSGADGLDHIRAMMPRIESALKPGGLFLLEIGWTQAEAVSEIVINTCPLLDSPVVIKDLAGLDRVIKISKTCV